MHQTSRILNPGSVPGFSVIECEAEDGRLKSVGEAYSKMLEEGGRYKSMGEA